MIRKCMALTGFIALLGMTAPEDCSRHLDRIVASDWGGEHMGMVVSDTGAAIEYDCAAGRITEPLVLDANGDFTWRGLFVPGHGGPVRIDEQAEPHVAQYSGHATRDHMSITLHVADSLDITQQFTLTRGANPRVFKCL